MRVHHVVVNMVASPSFPLTLGLEIVVMDSLGVTSILGLDSMENPVAGVISSIPNVSVDRLIWNRNYPQLGSVPILCSVGVNTLIKSSRSFVIAVR